jgi:DNA-directed RNA polymerase specialized sigma24 family protein
MLTRGELDSLYRANRHVVRRRLGAWRELQPADREDVEQKMWLKLVTSKKAERRDSNVAFLKRCANNAAKSFLEARNAQKNDADKTDSLGDEVVADTSFDFRGNRRAPNDEAAPRHRSSAACARGEDLRAAHGRL